MPMIRTPVTRFLLTWPYYPQLTDVAADVGQESLLVDCIAGPGFRRAIFWGVSPNPVLGQAGTTYRSFDRQFGSASPDMVGRQNQYAGPSPRAHPAQSLVILSLEWVQIHRGGAS